MFDEICSRRGTGSAKWDTNVPDGLVEGGAYPFSVADMEFKMAPAIHDALVKFIDDGFLCYTDADEKYRDVVREFMLRRHNWKIENDWITCIAGIVWAVNTSVRAFTNEGDKVIIQSPVYYPFAKAINNNNRVVADAPLIPEGNTYVMDFDKLEQLAADENTKLMLLCSPHNPVGRVWTKEELQKVGDICLKHNVVLVSDEIHFDLVRKNAEHTVINNVDRRFADNTVVCTAISKSFNVAGLGTSNIIIENDTLREKFRKQLAADGYTCINCVSRPATIAAYTKCDEWLDSARDYIDANIAYAIERIRATGKIKVCDCQGTYLLWLDMRALGMDDEQLDTFLREKCGIIPDPGYWFGENGRGFTRLNVACPRAVLEKALDALEKAIS